MNGKAFEIKEIGKRSDGSMRIFVFEDPGLYYGNEHILVVAADPDAAHALLVEHLRVTGRANDIMRDGITWETIAECDVPESPGVLPLKILRLG